MQLDERAQWAVVQRALARGFLSPPALREALLLWERARERGVEVSLLALLRGRWLDFGQLPELAAVYREVLGDRAAELPSEALLDPADLASSAAAASLPPECDPPAVRRRLEGLGSWDARQARAEANRAWSRALDLDPTYAPALEVACEYQGELGQGGMGSVSLVRDRRLGRRAALKRLRPELEVHPSHVQRFLREVRITARLDHPAIPPVYEAGTDSAGRPYLLMKVIEGRPLHELALAPRSGPLTRGERRTLRDLVEVVARVGEALAYAHARGVIHRDVKPNNVLVGRHGEVTLLDWGLARDLQANQEDDRSLISSVEALRRSTPDPFDPTLTAAGALLGTPGYMSPEQARGESAGSQADVFALGALLCQALCGYPPFVGSDAARTLELTRAGTLTPPSRRRRWLPGELDAIAVRAMQPALERRTATAQEVVDQLRAWLAGERVPGLRYGALSSGARWVRRHPLVPLVAVACVALLVLTGEQLSRGRRAAEPAPPADVSPDHVPAEAVLEGLLEAEHLPQERLLAAALELARSEDPRLVPALSSHLEALAEDLEQAEQELYLTALAPSGLEPAPSEAELRAALEAHRARPPSASPSPEVEAVLARARRAATAGKLPGWPVLLRGAQRQRAGPARLATGWVACQALGERRARAAIPALMRVSRAAADPDLAVQAIRALIAMGDAATLTECARSWTQFSFLLRGVTPDESRSLSHLVLVSAWLSPERLEEVLPQLQAGDLEAVARALTSMSDGPRDRVTLVRAYLALALGRGEEAGRLAERAVSLAASAREGIAARRALSEARVRQGRLEEGLAVLRELILLEPDDAALRAIRALFCAQLGLAEEARRSLSDAQRLGPGLEYVHTTAAAVAERLGEPEAVYPAAEAALRYDPEDPERRIDLAQLLAPAHPLMALVESERAIQLAPRSARAHVQAGVAQLRCGDVRAAEVDLTRALALDPQVPEARQLRGQVRLLLGDLAGARRDAQALREGDPEDVGGLLLQAHVSAAAGDLATARATSARLVQVAPRLEEAWKAHGEVCLQAESMDEALHAARRLLELAPRSATGHAIRARAHQMRAEQAPAREAAEQALAADPSHRLALLVRAQLRLQAGDREGARADLTLAAQPPVTNWVQLARQALAGLDAR